MPARWPRDNHERSCRHGGVCRPARRRRPMSSAASRPSRTGGRVRIPNMERSFVFVEKRFCRLRTAEGMQQVFDRAFELLVEPRGVMDAIGRAFPSVLQGLQMRRRFVSQRCLQNRPLYQKRAHRSNAACLVRAAPPASGRGLTSRTSWKSSPPGSHSRSW